MNIHLRKPSGETVAVVPVTTDEHGYLYADHPSYGFELDCALAGFHEGLTTGDIDDQWPDGHIVMTWTIEGQQ
jgi:hypothetical protein